MLEIAFHFYKNHLKVHQSDYLIVNIAALFGNLEICELFLETLDDKNSEKLLGTTTLHFAAENGHLKVCKVILELVDDKNPVANNGDTPLDKAAREGRLEIIQLLIDYGVDRRRIYRGWSPIKIAASHGHSRSCAFLMENFQDIISFFKGIWNYRSPNAVGLIAGLCGVVLWMIIILLACFSVAGVRIWN